MDPGSNFFSFLLINDHDLNVLGHNLEHTTIPPLLCREETYMIKL